MLWMNDKPHEERGGASDAKGQPGPLGPLPQITKRERCGNAGAVESEESQKQLPIPSTAPNPLSQKPKPQRARPGCRPPLRKNRRRCAPPLKSSAKGDLIGIGAAVIRRPLPHHRAYRSVHGGSSRLR